jgi:hypothetical protein
MDEAIQAVVTFFNSGLWEWLENALVSITSYYVLWQLKAQILFVGFSWEVAKNILNILSVSDLLTDSWSSLDNDVLNMITYFKIPESINVLLNAVVTRFVLSTL